MCDKCECSHEPDNGACLDFEAGMNGRCVYCDHAEACHPGTGEYFNLPLGIGRVETGITVELTAAEKDYIWLLTSLDAMRIHAMENDREQDYHYRIRHSLRTKLFGDVASERAGN